jgi:protein-S-isoprenylcysteine O-methyltransferase Ste14
VKVSEIGFDGSNMNRNTSEYLPSILNVVAAVGVSLISFFVELRFPISKEIAKFGGLFIVAIGMGLVIWAAAHIRGAFLGEVEPRLDVLVQDGPYRFVRHPVYLGMTIALAGIPVALRSWPGLIGVFVLFLPSEIYRARLEEKAMFRKFGSAWENYATQTGFILPRIG